MKWIKWTLLALGIILVVPFVVGLIAHEKEPVGTVSPEADRLAEDMLTAINKSAWDKTNWIQWTYADRNSFIWDKARNAVEVKFKDTRVLVNLDQVTGIAYEKGERVSGPKEQKLVQKAWAFFCNDAFWLNAPAKAFDPGTERSLVTLKDGRKGLKVKYNTGGVTPGDAYVWILDEHNRPISYKMWVQISPVGGIEFTWDDWVELSSGAMISTTHKGMLELKVTDLKDGQRWSDLGLTEDPLAPLFES